MKRACSIKEDPMKKSAKDVVRPGAWLMLLPLAALAPFAPAQPYSTEWTLNTPGLGCSICTGLTRTGGSSEPLLDFTVAALLSATNGPGVDQWAFGAATAAGAQPGSQSILVAFESAVINEEPTNPYPKIANNAVIKNRADGRADPGQPMNANSIAYWITAQPGTGFERGLVFHTQSLLATHGRAAAIDLSDLPDSQIGAIDLIRIRKNVSLRYDPATQQLVLHIDPTR
jgi:hypothetical protein